jgi:hypothetical protein
MGQRINFRVNYKKAIESIVWLANKEKGIDIYHVAKSFYYAEKLHINKYARPIIGDTYIAMDYGQVPSAVRDLIIKNKWMLDPEDIKTFSNSILVKDDPYQSLFPLRAPDLSLLSESDIECLKEALRKCKNLSFDELKKMSHDERSWLETDVNQPIDYSLMVDSDNPNKDEILEELNCTSRYMKL